MTISRKMDIKHREVFQWLQEMYGKEQVPEFEKTERSISLLHQLMKVSKRSEENAKILTADYTNKTTEYSAEGRQYNRWLEAVNMSPDALSEDGQKGLAALIQAAKILNVQIPTSSNIILAANHMENELMQILNEKEQEKGRAKQLIEMIRYISGKVEKIKSIRTEAEATWTVQQEDLAKDKNREPFVKEKCNNYTSDIISYEAKLKQVGVSKNIMHGAVCKQWSQLQDLEKEVSTLESRLKSYSALPPDMALAEVKVQEARQELAAIMTSVATACQIPSY